MRWLANILTLGCVSLLASEAHAGGYELFEQSASSAGVASAATARAGDASAAWHNPAALTDGRGFRSMLGLTLVRSELHAEESASGWNIDNDASFGTPFYGYISYSLDDWGVGVSVNVPYASKVRWPDEGAQRFEIIESQPNFVRFAPFFSYRLGDLSFAAGPHFDAGSLGLVRNLDFIDVEGMVEIRMRGVGVGGHAGLYWSHDNLALGVTYKSRTVVSLSGEAAFDAPPEFAEKTQDQTAEAIWRNPDRISLGAGVSIGEFQIYGDISYTLWTINDRFVIDFAEAATPDRIQVNDWENTIGVRLGCEWRAAKPLTIRAGLLFDQSPVPAETLAPSSPDSDRVGVSVGTGLHVGDFSFDAFYQLLVLTGERSTSEDAPPAEYSGLAHMMGLGISWSMDTALALAEPSGAIK